jgi:hypothetical protein
MVIVNTWRATTAEPLRRDPLALADRRSVPRGSLQRHLIGRVPCGQPKGGIDIYNAQYDPAHEWYYFPEMTAGELLIWKGFDSAEVRARGLTHVMAPCLRHPLLCLVLSMHLLKCTKFSVLRSTLKVYGTPNSISCMISGWNSCALRLQSSVSKSPSACCVPGGQPQ